MSSAKYVYFSCQCQLLERDVFQNWKCCEWVRGKKKKVMRTRPLCKSALIGGLLFLPCVQWAWILHTQKNTSIEMIRRKFAFLESVSFAYIPEAFPINIVLHDFWRPDEKIEKEMPILLSCAFSTYNLRPDWAFRSFRSSKSAHLCFWSWQHSKMTNFEARKLRKVR